MSKMARMAAVTATTALGAVALPAAAQAATVTVTGDDGNPLAINPAAPPTIRNVSVVAQSTVARTEAASFRSQVIGPDGAPASPVTGCRDSRFSTDATNYVDYRGNGAYRIVLELFTDASCTKPKGTGTYPYAIAAGVAIAQPQGPLMTRAANSFSIHEHQLPFTANPGTNSYEIRYAREGVIAADGSISGPSKLAYRDSTTGAVAVRFDAPGDWVLVARAQSGQYFTPWSAPVRVRVLAPFDLSSVTFPDSRGPKYRLKGAVREKAAAGRRVTISLAKGRRGGKFKRIGRPKVRRNGTFVLRFKVRRVGRYRLRYVYKGNGAVARGRVVQGIRIRSRRI
jgi:hypothetical protein